MIEDLSNAVVSGITAPGAPDKGGKVVYPAATAISVRAVLGEPTTAQRISMDALLKDVTAVVYVSKQSLPAGVLPAPGYEIRVTIDGGTLRVLVAEHVKDYEKVGGLSHFQLFCREGRK